MSEFVSLTCNRVSIFHVHRKVRSQAYNNTREYREQKATVANSNRGAPWFEEISPHNSHTTNIGLT